MSLSPRRLAPREQPPRRQSPVRTSISAGAAASGIADGRARIGRHHRRASPRPVGAGPGAVHVPLLLRLRFREVENSPQRVAYRRLRRAAVIAPHRRLGGERAITQQSSESKHETFPLHRDLLHKTSARIGRSLTRTRTVRDTCAIHRKISSRVLPVISPCGPASADGEPGCVVLPFPNSLLHGFRRAVVARPGSAPRSPARPAATSRPCRTTGPI